MDNFWFLRDFPKEFPSFHLDAVTHDKMSYVSELFSRQQVEPYLYVKIPPYIAREYELTQVDEIKDRAYPLESKDSDETPLWEHDSRRMWYKFRSDILDMETGYHNYRLTFQNRITGDTCLLYIAYTIQNNNPDKPYIYMDEARKYSSGEYGELGALAYKDYAHGTLTDYPVGVESTFSGSAISATAEYTPQGEVSDVVLETGVASSISDDGVVPSCEFPSVDVVDNKIVVSSGTFDPGSYPSHQDVSVATGVSEQPIFIGTPGTIEISGVPEGTVTNKIVTTNKEITVE